MRISYSNVRGKKTNTSYPFTAEINTADDLKKVAAFDHVCAIYKDGYNQRKKFIKGSRSNKTFQESDCLTLDCDNVSSDPLASDIPPAEWKTPKDVQAAYPDVRFFVVYSRNNVKEKMETSSSIPNRQKSSNASMRCTCRGKPTISLQRL